MNDQPKCIVDTIHGSILVRSKIRKFVDLPIFQRLAHVSQLTSTAYIFPCANHTRKEHCLGAYSIASKYANYLKLDKSQRFSLQVAALFHDIGHGPYSHSWDSTVYSILYPGVHKGHDVHRLKILESLYTSQPEIFGLVNTQENYNMIRKIWQKGNLALSAILQGPVGVDRMDFVRRDAHNTGTQHFGSIDIDRVIYNTSIHTLENNVQVLCYHSKIVPDLIQGLRSRLDMYQQVYLHKAVVAAAVLIEAMIMHANNYCKFPERTDNIGTFQYLADDFVLNEILSSTCDQLALSRIYAKALYERRLPKMISERKIILSLKTSRQLDEETIPSIEILNEPDVITGDISGLKLIWRSRILSNDFVSEFNKYKIHVNADDGIVPFGDYWRPDFPIKSYYLERVYSYS
jgi:HD superfamily phosphohydrolase